MKPQKLNKKILSIDYDDDQNDYAKFSEFLEEVEYRDKKQKANEIINLGSVLLDEIEHKKKIKNEEKKPLIKYILSKTNKYSEKYLFELDYNDVNDIYLEIKKENRPIIIKIIDFIFN
jgi:hypothetical protein